MKLLDYLGLQTLVTKIKTAVQGGTWLNVKNGTGTGSIVEGYLSGNTASGEYSHAEGGGTSAKASSAHAEGAYTNANYQCTHAEGYSTTADGYYAHAEGRQTTAEGEASHAEGENTIAKNQASHAEGYGTQAVGEYSHAQGQYNYASTDFIDMVGIGDSDSERKNAEVTTADGDKYLLNVGGYEGQDISSAKSVQSVINTMQSNITRMQVQSNAIVLSLNSSYTIGSAVDTVMVTATNATIALPKDAIMGRRVRIIKAASVTITSSNGSIYVAGQTGTNGTARLTSAVSAGYFLWFDFMYTGSQWYCRISKLSS